MCNLLIFLLSWNSDSMKHEEEKQRRTGRQTDNIKTERSTVTVNMAAECEIQQKTNNASKLEAKHLTLR